MGLMPSLHLFGQFEGDKTLLYLATLPNAVTLGNGKNKQTKKQTDEISLSYSIFATLSILDVGLKGRQLLNAVEQIMSA